MFLVITKLIQKENVDNLLRLRSLRHRQTPIYPKRVKAHAIRRELPTFVLDKLQFWRIGENKNLKADVHPICLLFLYLSQPIGICGFKGLYFI